VHKFSPPGYRGRSRQDEFRGVIQVHASRGDKVDVRKRPSESFNVLRSAHGSARKDLYEVGAGLPCRENLRGRQRAGNTGLTVTMGDFNYPRIERGSDNELRARQ